MKLLYVPMLVLLMTDSLTSAPPSTADAPRMTKTGSPVANLKGKMFTLTNGISLYPPNFTPLSISRPPSTRSYTAWPYTAQPYTARPYTAPPATQTRGVSVCLRYIHVYSYTNPNLFILSPSTTPLALRLDGLSMYLLSDDVRGRTNFRLQPNIRLWSKIQLEIWTRVCVIVDSEKSVAQVFSDFNMSVRRFLAAQYVWSGEPVIDIPGFNGQVTDVQVWDYPLHYNEVFNYMTKGSYSGNVLTWSSISYSLSGKALLEDVYEELAKQPISTRGEKQRRKKRKEGGQKA